MLKLMSCNISSLNCGGKATKFINRMHPQSSSISFGIIADIQYCNAPPFKNRYFKNSISKFKEVIGQFNRHNLDFVVNLGDLIDKDWRSYDGIIPFFKNLKAPVYHVLGNHDYEVDERHKPEVHTKLGVTKYYDFTKGNWRFMVLDGNEISTFANVQDSSNYIKGEKLLEKLAQEGKVNANFWNGGIGATQLNWLKQSLIDSEEKNQNVIIFCHFPIYTEHRHNLLNDVEVLKLIGKYDCVKAWFNGHNHHGNYGMLHNIHFVNVKGMVESEFDLAYSVVQLSETSIKLEGFGTEMSARLSI